MRFARLLILAPLLSIVACADEEPIAPLPLPIPVESFTEEYATALCGQAGRCQALAPYLVEQCKQERDAFVGDVASSVKAGRMSYDADAARRCVDGIAQTDCLADAFEDETLAACLTALGGKVTEGGDCYSFFECASGFCGGATVGECPSSCAATLSEGQACSLISGPDCDARKGLRCAGGVCTKPQGENAPCQDNNACKSGLVCRADGPGTATLCRPLHGEDELCSSDATCLPGLYCKGDDEGGECEERGGFGQPCGANLETIDAALRGVECQNGLVCKGAGLTVKGEVQAGVCVWAVGEGEACSIEDESTQIHITGCTFGLICPAGKCVLPPADGACALHDTCRPGVAYCTQDNTCAELRASGAACAIDLECQSGLCENDVCAPVTAACAMP